MEAAAEAGLRGGSGWSRLAGLTFRLFDYYWPLGTDFKHRIQTGHGRR